MFKKNSIIISIYALLIMSTIACSTKENTSRTSTFTEDVPIEVSFRHSPEKPKVKEQVELTVFITQKNKLVQDADRVQYELWEDGQEQHVMITAKKTKDGAYTSSYTFSKPGKYHVVYHVDARGFHNMKKNELTVLP
jgi:hypothetical protein